MTLYAEGNRRSLNALIAGGLFASLHAAYATGADDSAPTQEVSGTNFARVQIPQAELTVDATAGTFANEMLIQFARPGAGGWSPPPGIVVLWTAATGGLPVGYFVISPAVSSAAEGANVNIPAGQLVRMFQ